MDLVRIKRALFSVSDKEGIIGFAKFLQKNGVEILATGGTAIKLTEAGVPITPMEKLTGNPEAFGGRMKTISFPFASSLLYRRDNPEDVATAKSMGVEATDLVVCNLYPFAEAVKRNASEKELIEEIDVGGPTMVRAAAKNHAHVAVATHPHQYADIMAELADQEMMLSLKTRKRLAAAAFSLSARYEAMIAEELSKRFLAEDSQILFLEHGRKLRYGENPHQAASFYRVRSNMPGIASADILQGKELSYNNILDADAAHRSCSDVFQLLNGTSNVVSIVKHLNPCGLATGKTPLEALQLAWAGDPVSAFGGILCFSHAVDVDVVHWLADKFVELIIAPSLSSEALAELAKKKNLRVLLCAPRVPGPEKMLRSVSGGILVQDEDEGKDPEFRSVTKKEFPRELFSLCHFGVLAGKHLRSNAIALVGETKGNYQLVGAGMGQPNRVDSLRALAGPRAKEKGSLEKLILVSDAFFPFADIVDVSAELGIKFIVQPGGSIRDQEVIAACDRHGISMLFSERRHFRH